VTVYTSIPDSILTGNTTGTVSGTPLSVTGKVGSYAKSFNVSGTYAEASIGNYFGQNNPWTVVAWTCVNASSNGHLFGVTASNPPGRRFGRI
jgi:hypothetical protein